ncbi:hypothetical protein OGATHE_006254 [Ogataea polymorpha]|uniref:Uncharacterized protein n=1 Tax=Ogataea polymorpha TaxID=460523 RepID=A0A9P8NTC2_9ASCO|nr:hypothetical protein OGATHE_006254 [Ogataea polymorpha]
MVFVQKLHNPQSTAAQKPPARLSPQVLQPNGRAASLRRKCCDPISQRATTLSRTLAAPRAAPKSNYSASKTPDGPQQEHMERGPQADLCGLRLKTAQSIYSSNMQPVERILAPRPQQELASRPKTRRPVAISPQQQASPCDALQCPAADLWPAIAH